MKKLILTLAAMAVATNTYAMEHKEHQHMKHKHHTKHHMMGYMPLGIMGGHTHPKGKFMLSYQFMHMDMDGAKQGNNSITAAQVRSSGYMMAPLNMQMDMHMVGAMYGLTDDITLMGMVPYSVKHMEMERANGTRVNRDSRGLGDIKLSAIKSLYTEGKKALHGSLGISLPTGSIDEDYAGTNLAYSMQSGSGTPDLLGSITYTDMITDTASWGAHAKTTLRAGLNDNGYRLGNEYAASGWVSKHFGNNIGTTFIMDAGYGDKITGADATLNTAMMPGMNTNNYGGTRVNAGAEISYTGLKGNLFALKATVPVYENLKGIQGKSSYGIALGWKKSFHSW